MARVVTRPAPEASLRCSVHPCRSDFNSGKGFSETCVSLVCVCLRWSATYLIGQRRQMLRAFVGAAAIAAAIGLPSSASADGQFVVGLSAMPMSPIPVSQCPPGYYANSYGTCVERPDQNPSSPTALCCDGTTSHSQHRSGTCSSHGGVCQWNSMDTDDPNNRSPIRQRWSA